MKKEFLVDTASAIKAVSVEAIEEFTLKSDKMIALLNHQLESRHDIERLVGEGNINMMYDNHRNHIRFMISLLKKYDPIVFTETVLWVFRAYRSHGFKLTYWPAQLGNWVEIFKKELSQESFNQIYPYYHWMIINNPIFAMLSDSAVKKENVEILTEA